MDKRWEKWVPHLSILVLALLAIQYFYSRQDLEVGKLYIHSAPSGAEIYSSGAWSVHGFNEEKFLGRTPGPLNIGLGDQKRFVFTLKLFAFKDLTLTLTREELISAPSYKLQPRWSLVSHLLYVGRDYLFLWLSGLSLLLFWGFKVRPQLKSAKAQEDLWHSGQLQPGMLFHEYRLLELLGEGAAGKVYRADKPDEQSEESYTLKIFHWDQAKTTEAQKAALVREFENSAELSHPNIVFLLDWGTYRGYYYLVTEFVNGVPLDEVADYTLADVCAWGSQLVGALQHAHSRGVVHRDIKPSNVLLSTDDRVKVLDFGIAARVDSGEETGAGSIGYMAPEQTSGVVAPANDYYSLGVTLYQLASGRRPFEGNETFQILAAQAKGEFQPLTAVLPNCPETLEQLIHALLQKEAADRLTDPVEIQSRLDEVRRAIVDGDKPSKS